MVVVAAASVSAGVGGGGQLMTRVCATAAVQLAPQCNFALQERATLFWPSAVPEGASRTPYLPRGK